MAGLMTAVFAVNAGAQEIFKESGNLYSTRELTVMTPAPQHSQLVIKSAATLQGGLEIITAPEPLIMVRYTKKAKAGSRSSAIDYIDQIAVSLSTSAAGVKLELRAPNPAPWADDEMGLVEASIVIPEFCGLDIEAVYFDIAATGPFDAFRVPSSLGRLEVSFVTDELVLVTSNRRISIENASGNVKAVTSNSTLTAKNIKCDGGQAAFRNEGGDIRILGISGEVNIRNSYGRTEVDMFEATGEKSYIRSQYGPIEMTLAKVGDGQLILANRYEDIELSVPSNLSAELSVAVEENGKIEVLNFPFKPDLVQRNRLNLIAGDGDALISGSVRGKGNIYIRAYDPEED